MKKLFTHKAPHYVGVTPDDGFSADLFHEVAIHRVDNNDIQWAFHTNLGSLTVFDRLTGFGWRDIESGYRDTEDNFWWI